MAFTGKASDKQAGQTCLGTMCHNRHYHRSRADLLIWRQHLYCFSYLCRGVDHHWQRVQRPPFREQDHLSFSSQHEISVMLPNTTCDWSTRNGNRLVSAPSPRSYATTIRHTFNQLYLQAGRINPQRGWGLPASDCFQDGFVHGHIPGAGRGWGADDPPGCAFHCLILPD